MAQRPVAIGLHVCEQVIYEEETKNVTLVNCFRKRIVEQVPSEPFPFTVFAWLTDGQGNMTIDLLIQRADDLEEVYRGSAPLHLTSPLHEMRCRFRIRTCRFPTVGAYRVALHVHGEMIAQRGVTIAWTGEQP
jgi:hypothetical protein